ncbi:unnamed protein product [Somion occarium]|uniref:Uncharacterized protein n=1 Tax=Somion occarium TaxID=3059160 RepID=A0ABP1DY71_9APHY
MVQGTSKGLQKRKTSSSRHATKAAAAPKKGRRYIAPKKAAAVKSAALREGLSAKIHKSIEQQVASAASSGKLTIMKNVAMEGVAEKDMAKVKSTK